MVNVCLSLFTCFDGNIFSLIRCVGVTQLLSGFLSEGIALCVAVQSVSMGGRELRSHLLPSWLTSLQDFFKFFFCLPCSNSIVLFGVLKHIFASA